MEPGSVDTYTSALRQALLASTPDELLADAVERRLNALAAKRKSGSSGTALISGVRLLEKLRIIQAVVTEVHWMQARAIGKGWARRAQPKPVATWDRVEMITTSWGHWAWDRLVFLAICSIVYLWRVGHAASVTWEWISVPGFVTFWYEFCPATSSPTQASETKKGRTRPQPSRKSSNLPTPRTPPDPPGKPGPSMLVILPPIITTAPPGPGILIIVPLPPAPPPPEAYPGFEKGAKVQQPFRNDHTGDWIWCEGTIQYCLRDPGDDGGPQFRVV